MGTRKQKHIIEPCLKKNYGHDYWQVQYTRITDKKFHKIMTELYCQKSYMPRPKETVTI